MSHPSKKMIPKSASKIVLILFLSVLCSLAGCNSQKQGSTVYHSDNYGFSLSIPNEIYEELIIQEETDANRVVFVHYHENFYAEIEGPIPVWGHIFRVHILPLSEPAPENQYDSVYQLLTHDDQYNYYFWYLLPEQCESTGLREAYEPLFELVKKIPDSFVLDE